MRVRRLMGDEIGLKSVPMTSSKESCALILPNKEIMLRNRQDPYHFTRERVARALIQHTLIGSYHNFAARGLPYPFVAPSTLRPGAAANSKEFELQNSALVILVNGTVEDKLRKSFRFRESNRLCKENLQEVAPDLPELGRYKWSMRHSNHEGFDALLKMLSPLDYALLVQRGGEGESWPFGVSHFHVKVERSLDNAIRGLGLFLRYLERSLYEYGDEYVDILEKKFFEYFNFCHNASGRHCAAALAAQLLAWKRIPATVFISSQQTRRLTFLTTSDNSEEIQVEQYLLLNLDSERSDALLAAGKKWPVDVKSDFLLPGLEGSHVAVLRVRFEHTEAGRPEQGEKQGEQKVRILNPREKWIRLKDEALVSLHGQQAAAIGCALVYRRTSETDEKIQNILKNK
ncbi:MAG: hypothetical protein HQL88_05500 [Magnetococcales bacterium]|nr:hypothetical protein [Magnetococcales bacterium]